MNLKMKSILVLSLFFIIQASESTYLGIQLSDYDEVVHWDILKAEVQFVILRAGIGQGVFDSSFEKYYNKCKEIKLHVGAYWQSKAINSNEAEQEVKYFMKRLKGKQLEYPIFFYFDYEPLFKLDSKTIYELISRINDILAGHPNNYYFAFYSSKSSLYFNYEDNRRGDSSDEIDCWFLDYNTSQTFKTRYNKTGDPYLYKITDNGRLKGKPGDCSLTYNTCNYFERMKNSHKNGY